jgi:hypothetical protein
VLAYSLNTVPYLCDILRNKSLQRDTASVSAAKGIMRGLLVFLISEFKVNRLPDFDSLVDFASLIYTEEENLCLMFWTQVSIFIFFFFFLTVTFLLLL